MTVEIPYRTMTSRSMPQFANCCFCFPLRMGCFILGYLNFALNVVNTLGLIIVSAYIGVSTHGFDHFDENTNLEPLSNHRAGDIEFIEKPRLAQLGILLLVVLCSNLVWMIINIACLVGMHKKRPGPIRVYILFATIRLTLSFAGFFYLVMKSKPQTSTVFAHVADLMLAAYFILVYYAYAIQLENELAESIENPLPIKADLSIIYPVISVKSEKEMLSV